MQPTIQGIELSVAILMDDLASAKEIAGALRHNQILAHHYQSLDEFWVASKIQMPDLVIVDVTKMSQGTIQFKSHPQVVDGTLAYAFYSKDATKILLQSTLGLNPVAYIHNDSSLNAQIMTIVKRRAQELQLKHMMIEMENKMHRLQSRSQRLISDRSAAEEFRAHFEFIRNFCAELEEGSAKQDFSMTLLSKLEKWEAIDGYGIYELNQSGQKLVGPEVSRKKYHPFPALWLGQTNTSGIESFAQDMATQVANDLFDLQPVMLKVHSGSSHPEMLVYISFREERMANFPWDVFEGALSSSLRRLKLFQQLPHYSTQFLPMWEALDTMDKMQRSGLDSDTKIVCLSLIPLIEVAKKRTQNKFYWASFFNDFFLQLAGRLQKSTKLSLMGPWHVQFFIPRENVETETQMLQSFIRQFPFWKFFEDNSQILSEDMMPILKYIPASSAHYLRIFEKEFEDISAATENKRLMIQTRENRKATL
jgi:hypothetical protein